MPGSLADVHSRCTGPLHHTSIVKDLIGFITKSWSSAYSSTHSRQLPNLDSLYSWLLVLSKDVHNSLQIMLSLCDMAVPVYAKKPGKGQKWLTSSGWGAGAISTAT